MNYLTTIILLSISLVVSLLYTRPLIGEITDLGADKTSLSDSVRESQDLSTKLKEKNDIYINFTDDERSKINKILPDSIDNIRLVIDIENIASKYGMKIRNIDLKLQTPGQGDMGSNAYGTAILRFTVSTDYKRFRAFLNDLEDSLRLVDINSLSFTAGDKEVYEYNIELKTYWLKEIL